MEGPVKCQTCEKDIVGKYYQSNGKPLCIDCHKSAAPNCFKCKKPCFHQSITGGDGNPYHPDCFVCAKCNKNLANMEYVPHQGMSYHKDCYQQEFGLVCTQCGGYIEGPYCQNGDDKIHEKCLDRYKKTKGMK